MHKVTFFPLGNADCSRIDSEAGKKILFDYAATRSADDEYDVRIDLASELRADLKLAKRNDYDVVALRSLCEKSAYAAQEVISAIASTS
jgi:hypothetical protein